MRWLRAGRWPASLLLIVAATLFVPLPLYLERPGTVVSLAACVEIDDHTAGDVEGDYLLMTISVDTASAVDAVVAAVDPETALVARRSIIPSGVATDEFFRRQREVFGATRDVAAAVGLQAAGFPARVTGDGVSVVQVLPGSPADGALEPGDIITAIDGSAVSTEADLRDAVVDAGEGVALTLQVTRRAREVQVQVAPVMLEGAPRLGVVPDTVNPRVTLPVQVALRSGNVGGPSAGLMVALTVYDMALPGVDLAAGRIIGGTGTIDQSGLVGPVGGAGLKVIAAHRRGASVFLVPTANEAAARAALPQGSPMEIVAVETFEEARDALESSAGETAAEARDPEPCPYGEQGSAAGVTHAAGTLPVRRGQHRAGGLRGPVRRRPVNLVRAGRQQP